MSTMQPTAQLRFTDIQRHFWTWMAIMIIAISLAAALATNQTNRSTGSDDPAGQPTRVEQTGITDLPPIGIPDLNPGSDLLMGSGGVPHFYN